MEFSIDRLLLLFLRMEQDKKGGLVCCLYKSFPPQIIEKSCVNIAAARKRIQFTILENDVPRSKRPIGGMPKVDSALGISKRRRTEFG